MKFSRFLLGPICRLSWLVVLALGSLSACSSLPSVGPDYQVPAWAMPGRWLAAKPGVADAGAAADNLNISSKSQSDWWRQLGDPALDDLIATAQSGSLDLKAAQARLRQARASRAQAVSGYFPQVSASTGASRSKSAAAISAQPTRTLYDAGFDASWELDLFGGTRRAVEAAEADLAASAASLENVRVSLVAEVAQNYVEWRAYQSRLAIAWANLASQSETAQITEWRQQAGLASAADVEQAWTSREQTRASMPDLEVGLAAAENRLSTLLGQPPGALHEKLLAAPASPAVPPTVATGIPADVLRQRPDLIVAERTLAAETARIGQRQAARFPSLSLGGSFGWQAYSLGGLGGSGSLARAVSGTLAATLFDGGKPRSAVDLQTAVQEAALVAYENAVLTALEEVENALTAHAQARDRVIAREAAAVSARNAATLSRQMVEAGLADFQKVLETQRTQLMAEDSLATARSAVLTSLIQLYKALGGGWQADNESDRT
ncbi:efflux transporter outer membrane subunit [Ferribacterium limneticum]|uniref:efflux transporter outer membrane subunit n=1 Tax=Ferribacterium limneticum TaxID=76259 RepID=UPI001CFB0C50|nr:efflux transporter outer membrane subunit [Ferribacterium limneticum]UCV28238.1 efflux transporter outer membrane subunit [Ferribacterium limneticum]UCV32155.1 efflux transporter outer membrane subunit [Ferribacterium limneticum]